MINPGLNRRQRMTPSTLAIYVGFAVTGVATTMLGPILPALEARWSIIDAQAGILFTLQFSGSLLGAVLAPYSLPRSLRSGYLLLALSLAALGLATYHEAFAVEFLIGLGLGLAMTSTNIVVAAEHPDRRAASLSLLNLCWGAGAMLGAPAYFLLQRHGSLRLFLFLVAATSLLALAGITYRLRRWKGLGLASPHSKMPAAPGTPRYAPKSLLFSFGLLLFLYVGAENCVNGWVTTLSSRYEGGSSAMALTASTFWLSILLSRGVVVPALRRYSEARIRLASLLMAFAGTMLLLAAHSPLFLAFGAVITGIGFGPIFPLFVSALLARAGQSQQIGWTFACAGLGGAVLPWITGYLSSAAGSLRTGFLVPSAAMVILLASNYAVLRTKPVLL